MRSFLILTFLVAAGIQGQAQKTARISVPNSVRESFSKAHPNAKGSWEKEGSSYEVNFKEDGKEKSCLLDGTGKVLETETSITAEALPLAVKNYIGQNFKNKKIAEAAIIEKADGTKLYEAEINKKDYLFTEDGKPFAK